VKHTKPDYLPGETEIIAPQGKHSAAQQYEHGEQYQFIELPTEMNRQ